MRAKTTLNKRLVAIIQTTLPLLLPVLLVLIGGRIAMTETWLRFEYQRGGFPPDYYGWEKDVRLEYGPYGLHYILENQDISYLGDLVIEGETAFTRRELDHMEDVQVVARTAFRAMYAGLIIFLAGAVILARTPETRPLLWSTIRRGGINTLAIAMLLLLTALVSWDFFFDGFHALFFAEGSWQFYTSDTLIRLYPQQFWFDSAMLVGGITIGGALLCVFLPRVLRYAGIASANF